MSVLYILSVDACCSVTRITAFLPKHILKGFQSSHISPRVVRGLAFNIPSAYMYLSKHNRNCNWL